MERKSSVHRYYQLLKFEDGECEKGEKSPLHEKDSADNNRSKWASIRVIYFTIFICSIEYTVTIATLWPYLRKVDPNVNPIFLGFITSGYSAFHLIGSFVFGTCSQFCNRIAPFWSLVSLISIGSLLYILAQSFPGRTGLNMILCGRLMLGLTGGINASCRTEVTRLTTLDERANALRNLASFQAIGYAIGPVFQLIVSPLISRNYNIGGGYFNFNVYTVPGFVGLIMALLDGIAIFIWLQDVDVGHENEDQATEAIDGSIRKHSPIAVALVAYLYFITMVAYSVFDVLTSPLLIDEYALTNKQAVFYASIVLTVSGFLFVLTLQGSKLLQDRFEERKLLIIGFMLFILSYSTFIPWGNVYPKQQTTYAIQTGNQTKYAYTTGCSMKYSWCKTTPKIRLPQYIIGSLLFSMAVPIGFVYTVVILSKILGTQNQGLYMGIFTACGALGNMFGSMVAIKVYKSNGPRWTFLSLVILLSVSLAALIFNYKRIKQPVANIDKFMNSEDEGCK